MVFSFFSFDDPYGDKTIDARDTPALWSNAAESHREQTHILWEKLECPRNKGILSRSRLNDLIFKSTTRHSATLLTGRAGMGKTELAADFSSTYANKVWYSIESSDIDWTAFSHYFAAGVLRSIQSKRPSLARPVEASAVQRSAMPEFLIDMFSEVETALKNEPLLIVLDDLHRIFDAEWFEDFFNLLMHSLPHNTHLLLLSRSKPPAPLWRLRSKQVLNVIDESLLAFTPDETVELFERLGVPAKLARASHKASMGRISKLMQFAGKPL